MDRNMRLRTFTLIELLVVVAIIGILVSMLMPSLEKARRKAKTAVCVSQNKQIALAWELYISEREGKGFNYVINDSDLQIWTGKLSHYLDTADAFICPETENIEDTNDHTLGKAKSAWREGRYNTKSPWNTASYAYNINLCPKNSYATSGGYNTYQTQGQIESPSETPLTGDAWWRAPAAMADNLQRIVPTDLSNPSNDANGNTINKFITNRHGKVTVLSFSDGHAEILTFENVFRQQWHPDYNPDAAVINPH